MASADSQRWVLTSASVAIALVVANAIQVTRPELVELTISGWGSAVVVFTAGAAIVLVALRLPSAALIALSLVVTTGFSQVLVRRYGFPSFFQLLAPPLALVALAELPRGGSRAVTRPASLFGLGFLTWQLLSSTWAASAAYADSVVAETGRGFLIFVFVVLIVRSEARFQLVAGATVAASAALALVGVLQATTGADFGEFFGFGRIKLAQIYGDVFEARIAGPYGDPNFFAQSLLLVLPLAIGLLWSARSRRARIAAGAAAAVILAAIILTYSRGAALALGVLSFVVVAAFGVRNRRRALAILVLASLLFAVLPSGFVTRLATVTEFLPGVVVEDPDSSFEKRRVVTTVAWLIFLDHPFLGVGVGNYAHHFQDYALRIGSDARDYLAATEGERQYPHNLYLELLAEGGLVGLSLFLGLVGTILGRLASTASSAGTSSRQVLVRAVGLGLVGYLISALFLHGAFQRLLWMFLALAVATDRLEGPEAEA